MTILPWWRRSRCIDPGRLRKGAETPLQPPATIPSRTRVGAAVDLEQPLGVDGGVDLRGRERRVAKQLLDRAQIAAAGEEMRGEGVAQGVRGGGLRQAERATQARHGELHDAGRER